MRDPLIGTRINRYEIREAIHKSDLIGIYKAYDTKLERFVLIKTILHSTDYSQQAIEFFLAESRTLAKLAHPNIAKVLDFGYENGNLYLISEFVPGRSLSDLMTAPIPWQNAINILLPLTDALIYAHSRGILHRDLKPDNVIINTDDQPILSDFSLMRIIEEEETRDMTGTNVGLGSPGYISPEQGQGLSVDFRSDIYSLGVIFFEMVTGKKLFYATSSMEIVIQHIMTDPPKPRSLIPNLPRTVETIILNALSKNREKRFQTMEEFSNVLKAEVEAANNARKPNALRSRRLATISVLGVTLVLAALGFIFRNQLGIISTVSVTSTQSVETRSATATISSTPANEIFTQTPTLVSSETPTVPSIFNLPALPVVSGAKLPVSNTGITVNNVGSILELARWGNPKINQLAFINNEQNIAAATSAGVYFFDPKDLSAKYFFDTAGALTMFAISDDGEWLATGDNKGTVAVWSIRDGKQLYQLKGRAKQIRSLDFSADKSKLVFSDAEKNIHLWNLKQNQYYPFEKKHTLNINKVMFLADNNTVISGSDDFQIMIWDAPSGKFKDKFPASQKINDMALSSDEHYLALALNNATLQIWDFSAKQLVNNISDPEIIMPFTHITFLPNDNNILTGSADGFVRIWNTLGSEYVWESASANQAGSPVKTIAITQSGSKFVVGFENGLVEVWDLATKKRDISKDLASASVKRLVISPDDRVLAFQGDNSFVEILSLENASQNARINGTLPRGYPISPNNQMIGVVAADLNLYTLSTTAPTQLFTLYDFPTDGSVNYSPDSNIITAFAGGVFKYWSTFSGRELTPSLKKIIGGCISIYRENKTFIAAASEIGVIQSDKNLPLFCQIARRPRTISEKFLPDGSIIVLSLENQLVEIWDASKGDKKVEFKIKSPGHVLDVALSNDGKLLATASASGTIEIYNLETLELIKMLDAQTGAINQVLFSNNGKYLIAGSSDGTLRFFGLYP